MAKIKVDISRISDLSRSMKSLEKNTLSCETTVRTVASSLSWNVTSRSSIDSRLNDVQKRLKKQAAQIDSYLRVLNGVTDGFGSKDEELKNKAKGIMYHLNDISSFAALAGVAIFTTILYKVDEVLRRKATIDAFFGTATVKEVDFCKGIIQKIRDWFTKIFGGKNKPEVGNSDGTNTSTPQPEQSSPAKKTSEQTKAEIEARDSNILSSDYKAKSTRNPKNTNGSVNCVWFTDEKLIDLLGPRDPKKVAYVHRSSWKDFTHDEYSATEYDTNIKLGSVKGTEEFKTTIDYPLQEGAKIVIYLNPDEKSTHTFMIDSIIDGNVYYTDNRSNAATRAAGTTIQATEVCNGAGKIQVAEQPLDTLLQSIEKTVKKIVVLNPK